MLLHLLAGLFMVSVHIFNATNFALPATPPGYFMPSATGANVPGGHSTWVLTINTTGLPASQELANVVVQYHYTNVVLFPQNIVDAGRVTNTDGSVTIIPGTNSFTGWIDDCSTDLQTSSINGKTGQTTFVAYLGCDLKRIPNAYPDQARFLVLSSPGYASVPSATFDLD